MTLKQMKSSKGFVIKKPNNRGNTLFTKKTDREILSQS